MLLATGTLDLLLASDTVDSRYVLIQGLRLRADFTTADVPFGSLLRMHPRHESFVSMPKEAPTGGAQARQHVLKFTVGW